MRRAIAVAGFAALLVGGAGSVSASTDSQEQGPVPAFDHVFVIMMENTSFTSLIGNPNAPWINQAAHQFGLATNYFGVTHPSQPNYIAATSGSTNGVADDNNTTIDVRNIVDQVEGSGRTWTAYMQSYAACLTPLDHDCGNQLYERKHNPFISYQDVQSNPARVANIVDFSQLDADLASGHVSNYVWISPDQCHDMHGRGAPSTDPCNFNNVQGLITTGDTFLSDTVGKIMSSPAWTANSVIFVPWDESDFTGSPSNFGFGDTSGCCDAIPGGGHVVSLVITGSGHQMPHRSPVAYNHFSMLRTIEDSWQLGCLAFTCDRAHVPSMKVLVHPSD